MITLLPTPIGNLGDVSLRMLEVLADSQVVLCEDTRVTKKLITLLQKKLIISNNFPKIFEKKEFYSFHSHNYQEFLKSHQRDFFMQNVVFLSDAGMPCVSDPGASLVSYAQENAIAYDILPGSNACVLAYCMSGNIDDGFVFGGFLPHKQQDRRKCLQDFFVAQGSIDKKISIIFYESPHRILDSLEDVAFVDSQCGVFVIKEMTKKNQKYFRACAGEMTKLLRDENLQGEWVLVLTPTIQSEHKNLSFGDIENMDLPPKIKAKLLARISHQDVKSIYETLIKRV